MPQQPFISLYADCDDSDTPEEELLLQGKKAPGPKVRGHLEEASDSEVDSELHGTSSLAGSTLVDAFDAGGLRASKCSLIITEGESAKSFVLSGIQSLADSGRRQFGVYSLRGKIPNVSQKKIWDSEQITALFVALGLQKGNDYKSVHGLRYGRLILMMDQDDDGVHMKALIINLLRECFPSLLKISGFLVMFDTPVIKIISNSQSLEFYSLAEYKEKLSQLSPTTNRSIKYYKGLGTHTITEAQHYFGHMDSYLRSFEPLSLADELALSKVFGIDTKPRRKWIMDFQAKSYLDHLASSITIQNFIDQEFIHYGIANCRRAIPSAVDGLKPSQRKVVWASLQRNNSDIKVSELAGYVSQLGAYHHGENALCKVIIHLAQDFVGSKNNINILEPRGQFGTRYTGGEVYAAARYLSTRMNPLARSIFHVEDDSILEYIEEDGKMVEPSFYIPIIPMVLVNGARGIGMGWNSSIPPHNPSDIISNLILMIKGGEPIPMVPWWRNFQGQVRKTSNNSWSTVGVVERIESTIIISELPIGVWTLNYREKLQKITEIESIQEDHQGGHVKFTLKMKNSFWQEKKTISNEYLQDYFSLKSQVASTVNLVCFDFQSNIHKYECIEDILQDFYVNRLKIYAKRKMHQQHALTSKASKLENQIRCLDLCQKGSLNLWNATNKELERLQFVKHFDKESGLNTFSYLFQLTPNNASHMYTMEKALAESL
ncbi:topoisomerase Ii-Dna cleavage Complex, metal-bound [Hygrophoropsis aurantiaca]|uniref:Topoisomerase Ii-Dna cleavage Complex, metal-bound n=1 Tax=Hygrophoropsis aurantiaca TaxID=72124 RepID=A0ACB7ZXD0_9AGAM|nr:topoisomerase Ii-Dna cleavage Complex, metal-bound [Hygrophoropsis aurantiaca]